MNLRDADNLLEVLVTFRRFCVIRIAELLSPFVQCAVLAEGVAFLLCVDGLLRY